MTEDAQMGAVLAMEAGYEAGWSDGLPVLPPVREKVDEFLRWTPRRPDEVLLTFEHVGRECTVELAAANAVMAGCRPEYLPVVIAALEAIRAEGVATVGAWQSTTGSAPLLVVNGPVRQALGFNSAGNVFGPGFRANATVGRAIRLIILNVFGIRPHDLEQATQGTPAKYTCCIAENEEQSPWEPLHVDLGYPKDAGVVSSLHVRSIDFLDNRQANRPEQLLNDLANSITRTGAQVNARTTVLVVLGPEHAQWLAAQGYSKADVRQALWERAVRSYRDLARAGKEAVDQPLGWRRPHRAEDGPQPDPDTMIRLVQRPEDIVLVVAGAANAGVSAVAHALGASLNPDFQGLGSARIDTV
ncbi:MAG: hypothetical protein K6U14_01190 [Firmicutes bacterium]|nr:hypothetical protein [Alicyclobacillaceae bacterium]MCL6496233.1 hypothetical protein [Bacillota bacterium]